jgi:hypothetical protein
MKKKKTKSLSARTRAKYEKTIARLHRESAVNELAYIRQVLDNAADVLRNWEEGGVLNRQELRALFLTIDNISGAAGFLYSLVTADEPVRASCGNKNEPYPDDGEIYDDEGGGMLHIHDGLRCLAIIDTTEEERLYPNETDAERKHRYDVMRRTCGGRR